MIPQLPSPSQLQRIINNIVIVPPGLVSDEPLLINSLKEVPFTNLELASNYIKNRNIRQVAILFHNHNNQIPVFDTS